MPALLHDYPVHVSWTGGRDGGGTVTAHHSGENFPIAVPTEFQGPGGATNPEELLASAVAACYSITFGIIAQNRKLPVTSLEVEAVGQVEQNGATFNYQSIAIKPTIVLDATATEEHMKMAEDMAHKADNYCIITNAVRGKVAIEVHPTIKIG